MDFSAGTEPGPGSRQYFEFYILKGGTVKPESWDNKFWGFNDYPGYYPGSNRQLSINDPSTRARVYQQNFPFGVIICKAALHFHLGLHRILVDMLILLITPLTTCTGVMITDQWPGRRWGGGSTLQCITITSWSNQVIIEPAYCLIDCCKSYVSQLKENVEITRRH